jgi:hypothetical protein
LEGRDRGLVEVLPRKLLGGTEEYHKKPTKLRTKRLPNTNLAQTLRRSDINIPVLDLNYLLYVSVIQ